MAFETFPHTGWFYYQWFQFHLNQGDYGILENKIHEKIKLYPQKAFFYFGLGEVARKKGNHTKMQEYYEQGLTLEPKNYLVRLILARALWELQKYEEAYPHLEILYKNRISDLFIYQSLSFYYNGLEQTFSAENVILEGLELDPQNQFLLLQYIEILEKRKKYKEAKVVLQELLEIDPQNPSFVAELGKIHLLLDNFNQAEIVLKDSLEIEENLAARFYLAQVHFQRKEYHQALANLKLLTRADFQSPSIYILKAQTEFNIQQYNQALGSINKAQTFNTSTSLKIFEVKILMRLKDYESVEVILEQILDSDPQHLEAKILQIMLSNIQNRPNTQLLVNQFLENYHPYIQVLEIYYSIQKQRQQLWQFELQEELLHQKILNYELDDSNILLKETVREPNHFFLRYLLKDFREEKLDFELEKFEPKTFWHWYYVGHSYLGVDEPGKALQAFLIGKEMNPDFIWIDLEIAVSHQRLKNYHLAAEFYQKFLKHYPNNQWVKNQLAYVYDLSKQFQKSEQIYLEILALNPKHTSALNNLAWLYLTQRSSKQKKQEAFELVKKAVSISPQSANLDTLAEFYYQNQEYKKAFETIERALTQDRENLDHFKKQKYKIIKTLQSLDDSFVYP